MTSTTPSTGRKKDWWRERRSDLLADRDAQCPAVVFNEEALNDTVFDLLSAGEVMGVHVPVVGGLHQGVLEEVIKLGAGFRCFSGPCLDDLAARFPDLPATQLLLAHEGARPEDYRAAFRLGARVAVLQASHPGLWPELFARQEILVGFRSPEAHGPDSHDGAFETSASGAQSAREIADRVGCVIKGGVLSEACLRAPQRCEPALSGLLGSVGELVLGSTGTETTLPVSSGDLQTVLLGLEHLSDHHPDVGIFLAPGLRLYDLFSVLLTRVLQTRVSDGARRVRIDLSSGALACLVQAVGSGGVVNLSRPGSGGEEGSCLLVGSDDPDRAFAVAGLAPAPTSTSAPEPGDVLLFPGCAWAGLFDVRHGGLQRLHTRYLKARRICQVPL